jgi:Protein of unknown function DUF111
MPDSPVLDLGFARLDLGREQRQGLAEVVYARPAGRIHSRRGRGRDRRLAGRRRGPRRRHRHRPHPGRPAVICWINPFTGLVGDMLLDAGTRQLPDRPNVASVALGAAASVIGAETVEVLETNLDDVSGETLGYVISRALAIGALDAWVTPAVMKKGRPAHVLHVLTRPEDTPALRELIFAETGTLGIRCAAVSRADGDIRGRPGVTTVR